MQGPSISGTPQITSVSIERTAYVWGIAVVAALGGLLFGYDWVVIGGARQFYEIYFRLASPGLVGWANSCALSVALLALLPLGILPIAMAAVVCCLWPACYLPFPPRLPDGRIPLPRSSSGVSWAARRSVSVRMFLPSTSRRSVPRPFAVASLVSTSSQSW